MGTTDHVPTNVHPDDKFVLCNRCLTKELLNAKPSVTDLKIVKNAIMIKHNKILLHVRTN